MEERTYQFARRVRAFVKTLPRTICNMEDVKQVVRSSGSIGANYIEANAGLSREGFPYAGPDFKERIEIIQEDRMILWKIGISQFEFVSNLLFLVLIYFSA